MKGPIKKYTSATRQLNLILPIIHSMRVFGSLSLWKLSTVTLKDIMCVCVCSPKMMPSQGITLPYYDLTPQHQQHHHRRRSPHETFCSVSLLVPHSPIPFNKLKIVTGWLCRTIRGVFVFEIVEPS